MKIVILGAGISGLIAAGAFAEYNPIILERGEGGHTFSKHRAVMRLRDDKIRSYVPVKLEEVGVHKAIYSNGKMYNEPSILLNNMYSLKVYGALGDRSLGALGKVRRYLLKDIQVAPLRVLHNAEVFRIGDGKICVHDSSSDPCDNFYDYDACISTIPLPALLKIVGWGGSQWQGMFRAEPINIVNGLLNLSSDVNQTVYFPDRNGTPYRATIQRQEFIAESMGEITGYDLDTVMGAFGLSIDDFGSNKITDHKQKLGKILPCNNYDRQRLIVKLTEELGIYSFGRFATWRSLRVDQTFRDIERIKLQIRVGDGRG